jgi:CPA1 family monovalent cation:H+ antiporter
VTTGIDDEIPHVLDLLVGLLGLAAFVAIVVRPLRLPYTVALVVAGLIVGFTASATGYPQVDIPPHLVLLVLLPGLVFEAAYKLRIAELRRWFGGLLLLAIPGVVISAAVVAVVLNLATGLRLDLAFIVGAMVSATDPAAVIATFKRLRVPHALSTMVDGESLLNDGTGLVLFAIAVGAVRAPVSPAEAVVSFIGTVLLSGAIGLVTGFAAARVIGSLADHLIELVITVVLAYGSYLLADQFGLSGVIATVTAGIVLGNLGPARRRAQDGSDPIDTVWEFIAYLLTAFVFLLVGLAIPPARLLESVVPIAWGIVAILVGRAFVVYVVLGGASRLTVSPGLAERIPRSWLHVLFWAGLRGAVALAMALSLPADIPQRSLLQEITFGVILFTLLIQGTTIGWVVDHTVRRHVARAPAAGESQATEGPAV